DPATDVRVEHSRQVVQRVVAWVCNDNRDSYRSNVTLGNLRPSQASMRSAGTSPGVGYLPPVATCPAYAAQGCRRPDGQSVYWRIALRSTSSRCCQRSP